MHLKTLACKICHSRSTLFCKTVFCDKFDVTLWECHACNFIFAAPVTWLGEVYKSAISKTDTGYVWRNERSANILAEVLGSISNRESFFIDFGSGYGLLVRMMRDRGFRFHSYDPYCKNLFAEGFEA